MPGWRRLAVAGLVALCLGLLIMFPARVACHWFAPDGVALAGIDGSVWRGTARAMSADGLYLRDVQWRWLPGRLLTARFAYHLEAVPGGGFLNTNVGAGLTGSVYVDELRASVPLPLLEALVGVPGLQGTANANVGELQLKGGIVQYIDGTVEVSGLVVPMLAATPLGRYRVEFQTQDGSVLASIQDDGAVVDLTGRLQLGTDRQYDFLGHVAATGSTPEAIVRQFQFLGSPNAEGQYELRLSGVY